MIDEKFAQSLHASTDENKTGPADRSLGARARLRVHVCACACAWTWMVCLGEEWACSAGHVGEKALSRAYVIRVNYCVYVTLQQKRRSIVYVLV